MRQEVRFCTASDGVRLAYAVSGRGPLLVKAGHWLTHLERDWESPVWRHWLEALSSRFTVVRYDERGCGLSDPEPGTLTAQAWVGDLETVAETLGAQSFLLLGMSQGGPTAIAYAARHPERVGRLVLYGTYARGRLRRDPSPAARAEAGALVALTRMGWGRSAGAYRRLFTTLFVPGASEAQMAWFDDLQQSSCSADHAARARAARYEVDVTAAAASLRVPTVVLHARHDALVPFDEGRRLAGLIPGAAFAPLEGANHILLEDEPAWLVFLRAFDHFVGRTPAARPLDADLDQLTRREREVLTLVARGDDNGAIARAMNLSVRTVERHLSNVYLKLGLAGRAARAGAAGRFAAGAQSLR